MIIIQIGFDNQAIASKISVSGHAGYDVYGKDIVCAAVSTAVQLTTLALQNLIGDNANVTETDDGVTIDVGEHSHNRAVGCVIIAFAEFVNELQATYPANVEVNFMGP